MEYRTKNTRETQTLGKSLGSALIGGEVIALKGEMGSGKTTFVQGLAEGIGLKNSIVSPTFILMRHYVVPNATKNFENVYHVDLYRLENNTEQEIAELGITDLWGDSNNVFVIEWAERLHRLPENCIEVEFKLDGTNDNSRIILMKNQPSTVRLL